MNKYTIFGFISVFSWSIWPLLAALAKNVPPLLATSIYFLGAVLFLSLRRLVLRQNVLGFYNAPIGVILVGGFGLFGYALFFNLGVRNADPVIVSLITYLWPILVLLFIRIKGIERLPLAEFAGAGLCFLGLFFVLNAKMFNILQIGVGYAFLSALCWSFYNSYRIMNQLGPPDVFAAYCTLGGVCALIASFAFQENADITPLQVVLCLMVGVVPVAIGNSLWDNAIKYGNRSLLMHLAFLTPVLSTGLLYLSGQGSITAYTMLGVLLIMGGLGLSATSNQAK